MENPVAHLTKLEGWKILEKWVNNQIETAKTHLLRDKFEKLEDIRGWQERLRAYEAFLKEVERLKQLKIQKED